MCGVGHQVPHTLRDRPGPLLPHDARCGPKVEVPQTLPHHVPLLPSPAGEQSMNLDPQVQMSPLQILLVARSEAPDVAVQLAFHSLLLQSVADKMSASDPNPSNAVLSGHLP